MSRTVLARLWAPGPVAALGVALVLVGYAPSLSGPFFTDDYVYVLDNGTLRQLSLARPWEAFTRITNPFEYLPLRDLSLRVDLALFGRDPLGYKLHNLLLYLLCCAAAWWCAACLGRAVAGGREGPGAERRHAWQATVVALLFAAHPAHVESVAWVSGRKDLLSGLGALLALGWFASAVADGVRPRRKVAAATLAFLAAGLSKATVLPLPGVAILVAVAAGGRGDDRAARSRRFLKMTVPLVIGGLALLVVHLAVGRSTGIVVESGARAGGVGAASARAVLILGTLVRVALAPVGLRLIYDVEDPEGPLGLTYLLGAAALVAVIPALRRLRRGRALPALGLSTFVVFCLPFLQLVPFRTWSLASERFLFLPVFGLALAVGAVVARGGTARAVVFAVVFAALAAGTSLRARDWASSDALLLGNFEHSPRHRLAVEFFVDALLQRDRHAEALAAIERLGSEDVARGLADYVRADAVLKSGDRAGAARLVADAAARLGWASRVLSAKIGNIALEANDPALAVALYREVLTERPSDAALHYNAGLALKRLGRQREAADEFRTAVELGMETPEAFNQLGVASLAAGDLDQAAVWFERAIALDGSYWHATYNLARVRALGGRVDAALALLDRAERSARARGDDSSPIDELRREIRPGG